MEELQNQLEDSDAEMCRLQEAVSKSAHLMEQYDGQALRAERDSAVMGQKQSQADLAELQRQQLTLCEEKSSLEAKADGLAEDVATLKDELEECQRLLSFADIEHGILEKALTTAQASKEVSEAQAKRVVERLKEAEEILAEQEESARAEQGRIQDDLSNLRDDHAALQLEHEDLVDGKRQLEVKLESMTTDFQRIEAESLSTRQQLEKLATSSTDAALVDLHRRTQELEGRVVRRNQLIATEQAKLKKVEMNLDIATEDIEQLEAEITRLNNENVQLGEQARAREADTVKRQADLTAEIEILQREISASQERESQLQSSLDEQSKELASLIEQLAQSANDVQAIMARTTDQEERMREEIKAEKESIQSKTRQEVETLELVIANLEKKQAETQRSFDELVVKMQNSSQEIEALCQSRESAEERLEAEMRKGEQISQQLADSATRAEARAFDHSQEIDHLRSENGNLINTVEESRQRLELQTQAIARSEELLASKDLKLKDLETRLQTDIQDDAGARAALQQELEMARAELASSVVAGESLSLELHHAKEAYDHYVEAAKTTQEEIAASKMAIEGQLKKVQESHTEALASLEERSQALRTTEERRVALAAKLEEMERLSATVRDEKVQASERSERLEQNFQAIVVEVEELRVDLSTQTRLNAELEAQRAQAGSKVDELTRQIDTQRIAEEQLNKSLAEYSRDRFQALAENDQLREVQKSLQIQLEEQIQALGMLQSESERAAAEKSRLEQALQAKYVEISYTWRLNQLY
jgi:chromosome segregation ATPase